MTKRIRHISKIIDTEQQSVAPTMSPDDIPPGRFVCAIPECVKWHSDMPWLHLCNAHLAIVHEQVETRGPMGLISVVGHQTSAQRLRYLEARVAYLEKVTTMERPTDGIIYYVQSGGHIKIGWTSDLAKRMRAYPPNCQLLATHPGTRANELKLHKMFAAHRSHGREWYPLVPAILHHIDMMKTKHGEPEGVTFGAKPVTIPQHRDPQYVGGYPANYGKGPLSGAW